MVSSLVVVEAVVEADLKSFYVGDIVQEVLIQAALRLV
jgi:hypothetical protein